MDELKRLIEKRRVAFARFDALPEEEKRQRRAAGLDPHEPKVTRELKKAVALSKRKKEFDKLPKDKRDILTAIGWNPYQSDKVINRSTSYYETHGTYVIDKDAESSADQEEKK